MYCDVDVLAQVYVYVCVRVRACVCVCVLSNTAVENGRELYLCIITNQNIVYETMVLGIVLI